MAKDVPENPQPEEEINLGPGAPRPANKGDDDQAKEQGSGLTIQRHSNSTFKDSLDPTLSPEDILDRVIQAPSEQLIPWEQVELPSKGLYYNWSSGVIDVRPWGIQVDKILATDRMIQSGQAIDYVLAECCKFPPGFDPAELLVGDQIFLLYYLRGITHGNVYEFAAKTPNGEMNHYVFDMNELSQTIQYADETLGDEPFQIRLPYLSEIVGRDFTVGVRFLRVRDTQSIARMRRAVNKGTNVNTAKVRNKNARQIAAQRRKQRQAQDPKQATLAAKQSIPVDDALAKNIEVLIVEANGSRDRMKIRQLVNSDKFHSSDSAVIREWLANNSPGIDTTVELTDPDTGDTFPVMLPITESFFRPQE